MSRGKSRTYKGHGDDYAVVEKGLMALGGGSRVVMQQAVRARRRRTLVLHTPPSLPPTTNLPSAGPRDGGRCKSGQVSLTTAAAAGDDVGCRLRPQLALAPFSVPASGKRGPASAGV